MYNTHCISNKAQANFCSIRISLIIRIEKRYFLFLCFLHHKVNKPFVRTKVLDIFVSKCIFSFYFFLQFLSMSDDVEVLKARDFELGIHISVSNCVE